MCLCNADSVSFFETHMLVHCGFFLIQTVVEIVLDLTALWCANVPMGPAVMQ